MAADARRYEKAGETVRVRVRVRAGIRWGIVSDTRSARRQLCKAQLLLVGTDCRNKAIEAPIPYANPTYMIRSYYPPYTVEAAVKAVAKVLVGSRKDKTDCSLRRTGKRVFMAG